MKRLLLALVGLYQRTLTYLVPVRCRYYPTCSVYSREAIERHGAGRGLLLSVRRVLRCRPLGGSGFDPVPGPRGD